MITLDQTPPPSRRCYEICGQPHGEIYLYVLVWLDCLVLQCELLCLVIHIEPKRNMQMFKIKHQHIVTVQPTFHLWHIFKALFSRLNQCLMA